MRASPPISAPYRRPLSADAAHAPWYGERCHRLVDTINIRNWISRFALRSSSTASGSRPTFFYTGRPGLHHRYRRSFPLIELRIGERVDLMVGLAF